MVQKSYDNSPTVYLIPTPIGNMEDITLRAINILKKVEVLFTEDTRVTGLLLNNLGIKKKLISNHKYNEETNFEKILKYLNDGYDVGIVTDRGTPIISDPGYGLTKFVIENGFNLVCLPGATALIPALAVSGLPADKFLFYGFLDSRQSKRRKELENLKMIKETIIFYESPHRIEETLNDMGNILGNRKISISREISKLYEEVYRGNIWEILKQGINIKGEFVIVVSGNNEEVIINQNDYLNEIDDLIKNGVKTNDAIKIVSKKYNLNKSDVYKEYHENK